MTIDYFFFVLLFQHVLAFILSLLSLYFSINFLRYYIFNDGKNIIATTMLINFIFILIFSIISLIYYLYLFIFLRNEINYDPKIIYLTGLGLTIMINLGSLIEFFLCIDRCFAILLAINYTKSKKGALNFVAIFSIIALSIFVIYVYIGAFPTSSTTTCMYFGCLLKSNSSPITLIKIVLIILNFSAATCLAILIRLKFNSSNQNVKRMNKTVLHMVLCTTVIELIPFAIAQGFLMINGFRLASVVGPYAFTVSTINIALSGGIYYNVFKKYFINNVIFVTSSI